MACEVNGSIWGHQEAPAGAGPMSVTSGSTVVFQKFATADSGALVMVTPSILRESTPMK
jgi:hypothetical protein